MKRLLAAVIGIGIFSAGCITSGKNFDTGILRREGVCVIPFYFNRDETHVSYSIFYDNFIACGASFAGNQYVDILFGCVEIVNIPGLSWLLYPFQYSDASTDSAVCAPFGIGSGYGDLRISLLWGFLSLGRNWNVFWINGFWHPGNDPLYFEKLQAGEKMPERAPRSGMAEFTSSGGLKKDGIKDRSQDSVARSQQVRKDCRSHQFRDRSLE